MDRSFCTRDCSCGNGHCKNVYLKARQFDPGSTIVKIKGLITTDPRILKPLDQIRSLLISN